MLVHEKKERAIYEPNRDVTMRVREKVVGNKEIHNIIILAG